MENFSLEKIKNWIIELVVSFRKIIQESWPINWSNFKKFKLVGISIVEASYPIKVILTASIIGFLISSYFFIFGVYLVATKEVPDSGGDFREAISDQTFKLFNPVLELSGEGERKVANLLYHPLYEVDFPDYLNSTTQDISFKPILLSKTPQWQDLENKNTEDRYKILRFELRKDIKWSDQSEITLDDIEYTFERLKENTSNSQFRDIFSKVELVKVSKYEFDLRSSTPNPQLINVANFSPIPATFFEKQTIDKLYNNFNSSKPLVTSGYFTFTKDKVKDPNKNTGTLLDNPIKEDGVDGYNTVVLSKNPVQNAREGVKIDKYIIQKYTNLFDIGGTNVDSIERASKNQKVDLFTRSLGPNTSPASAELNSKLGLNQKVIGTNVYYEAFLNIRRSDVFLNYSLRKYLICSLINFNINQTTYQGIENIPKNKRVLPIQIGAEFTPECPENNKDILDNKTYKLEEDTKTNIKKVLVCGRKCNPINKLTLIGFEDSNSLLVELQAFLRDIGMPADLITGNDEVQKKLGNKEYSIAFLPINLVSKDPYPLYGMKGRDLIQFRANNQKEIVDSKIEDTLYKYSTSGLTDQESKDKLTDFFSKEFVGLNLFRSLKEINYSDRVGGLNSSMPSFSINSNEVYSLIASWYVDTKREWKFK